MEWVYNEFKRNKISVPYNQLEVRERKDKVPNIVIGKALPKRVEKVRPEKKANMLTSWKVKMTRKERKQEKKKNKKLKKLEQKENQNIDEVDTQNKTIEEVNTVEVKETETKKNSKKDKKKHE